MDYDPAWPIRYEHEKKLVLGAIGPEVLGIEHVGSTAVPGLAAKPVVDILAGVKDQRAADGCLAGLAAIGYTDVTPCPEYPDWYYCIGKGEKPHDVHLHLCQHDGRFWERHLRFRGFLRLNPDVAEEYGRLKRRLAVHFGTNRQGYCDAKTGFVRWAEVQAAGFVVRPMVGDDVGRMHRTFARWNKERSWFQRYLLKQHEGEREVLVAQRGEEVVGYACLVWTPKYRHFREQGIPELVDLNVIDEHQGQGVGSALVYEAERTAAVRGKGLIGISVVQSSDFRAANRLYPSLGFVPDGRGVTVEDNELHLTKEVFAGT